MTFSLENEVNRNRPNMTKMTELSDYYYKTATTNMNLFKDLK
jgi:hypothetical protein